jgi:hypothetical protein
VQAWTGLRAARGLLERHLFGVSLLGTDVRRRSEERGGKRHRLRAGVFGLQYSNELRRGRRLRIPVLRPRRMRYSSV